MSTLANASTRAAVRARIANLRSDVPRQWGRMTPHQMVCHLNDAFGMADGSRMPKRVDNIFSRSVMRYVALHTSVKWPESVKTAPEVDQERDGTPPTEWQADLDELLRRYDAFAAREGNVHPFFGPMKQADWNIWAFRHIDHHLRQFGS